MHLATTLAGFQLEHPLMNAAGTCKTLRDVENLARSAVSAIVVGSITSQARMGNEGQVYWPGQTYSLNSLGMPNPGGDYYGENLPHMVELAHAAGKPLAVNVAGFKPAEYGELAQLAHNGGADFIELNLGCPNVWDDGDQKRIASFDPSGIAAILAEIERRVPDNHPVGVKLSPYSDPGMLAEVAQTIKELPISYVATTNTFPNAFVLDENGKPVINVGLAGMSGAAIKPVGLGQVKQLRQLLPDSVQLVGVGGIANGRDMLDYLRVGACATQAATAYWNSNENPGVFGDILSDYIDQFPEEE